MAAKSVTVHTGNYGSYLWIGYEFTNNTTNRTWTLSTNMYLYIPKNYTFGSWSNTGVNSGNLVKGGIDSLQFKDMVNKKVKFVQSVVESASRNFSNFKARIMLLNRG